MISPTIGRVVLYWPSTVSGRTPDTQPWPALVCRVFSDTCINLAGFNNGGTSFSASSCRLIQDDEQPPTTGAYAEWMPYQKAQAAKHEPQPPVDNAFVAPSCEQFAQPNA